jgi:hypothetical protein
VDFGLPCLDCALLTVHLGSGAQLVIFLAVKSVSLPVFFFLSSRRFPLRIEFDSLRWIKSLAWSLLVPVRFLLIPNQCVYEVLSYSVFMLKLSTHPIHDT